MGFQTNEGSLPECEGNTFEPPGMPAPGGSFSFEAEESARLRLSAYAETVSDLASHLTPISLLCD